MKYQVLFSLKNKINFRLSSASICLVLYGLTNIDNSWPLDQNRLKYKATDKSN